MRKRRQYSAEDIERAKTHVNDTIRAAMDSVGDDLREAIESVNVAGAEFQTRRAHIMDRALRNYAGQLGGEDFAAALPANHPVDEAEKLVKAGEIVEMIDEHFPGHGELASEHARMVATEEIFHPIRTKMRRFGRSVIKKRE